MPVNVVLTLFYIEKGNYAKNARKLPVFNNNFVKNDFMLIFSCLQKYVFFYFILRDSDEWVIHREAMSELKKVLCVNAAKSLLF